MKRWRSLNFRSGLLYNLYSIDERLAQGRRLFLTGSIRWHNLMIHRTKNKRTFFCTEISVDFFSKDRRRCNACAEQIKEEAVLAMNALWHPEHFVCVQCKAPIKQTFQERNNEPYCVPCYGNKFNPKCAGCNQTLHSTCVQAMNKHWHQGCFVCTQCRGPFPQGEYYLIDNQPFDLDCHWGKRLEKHSQAANSSRLRDQ